MTILKADTIITMDENNTIIRNGAVAFDETIHAVSHSALKLRKLYPQASYIEAPQGSIVFPALINSHLHFEFSANETHLIYGDFHQWLASVIEKRDELMAKFNDTLLHEKIDFLARTGTATVGAVSSYGYEINALSSSPLRVVLFNEAIGSKPDLVDTMFSHLISRIDDCEKLRSPLFTPAVAIHSPYSVHPDLVKMALSEVKEKGYSVSTHFMESPEERKWLERNEGKFAPFFKNFLQIEQAFTTPEHFLESFESLSPLITHAIHTTKEDHELFQKLQATVTHCPVSNRLLGAGVAPYGLYKEKNIPVTIGTDGLSSNISLSLFDEMRAALMVHAALPLEELAYDLLKGCTSAAAKALKTENGSLESGKKADIAIVLLPDVSPSREDFFTQLILQTQEVESLYIEGKKYVRKN